MSESTLSTLLIILLIFLIPLLLSYWVFPDEKIINVTEEKKSLPEPKIEKDEDLSFEKILEIFSHKSSSKDQLKHAIEQLIRNHGKIHAKLGDLAHPDFKRYLEVIMALCSNPQADKDIIVSLDQKLRVKNPKYGLDIDEAVNKGIAKRGF